MLIFQRNYPDIHVHWVQGDWLNAINLDKIDIIISNPPYVESDWQDSSILFEPKTALYSGKDGLDDIKKIPTSYNKNNGSVNMKL